MERTRKFTRQNIQKKVSVRIESRITPGKSGELTSLGFGGAFLTTAFTLPMGSIANLTIPLNEKESIQVQAKVVYLEEGKGIGFEFTDLSARDAERIGVFLFLNQND